MPSKLAYNTEITNERMCLNKRSNLGPFLTLYLSHLSLTSFELLSFPAEITRDQFFSLSLLFFGKKWFRQFHGSLDTLTLQRAKRETSEKTTFLPHFLARDTFFVSLE
jgi:hypothetical protein